MSSVWMLWFRSSSAAEGLQLRLRRRLSVDGRRLTLLRKARLLKRRQQQQQKKRKELVLKSVLDAKKAYNIEIALKRLKLDPVSASYCIMCILVPWNRTVHSSLLE